MPERVTPADAFMAKKEMDAMVAWIANKRQFNKRFNYIDKDRADKMKKIFINRDCPEVPNASKNDGSAVNKRGVGELAPRNVQPREQSVGPEVVKLSSPDSGNDKDGTTS